MTGRFSSVAPYGAGGWRRRLGGLGLSGIGLSAAAILLLLDLTNNSNTTKNASTQQASWAVSAHESLFICFVYDLCLCVSIFFLPCSFLTPTVRRALFFQTSPSPLPNAAQGILFSRQQAALTSPPPPLSTVQETTSLGYWAKKKTKREKNVNYAGFQQELAKK